MMRYNTIADIFQPLYPTFGLTVDRSKTGEVELMRLFYRAVIEGLPPGTKLVVHAHDPAHELLYRRRYKFKLERVEYNALWKTEVRVLTQTREEFLRRLEQGST